MIIDLLQRVCSSLEDLHIPYMVSGSIALNIYSIPRMTRDIDIVIELEEDKVDNFIKLFPNSYYNKNTIIDEIKKQGIFNIIDNKTGFKIDFIIRKNTDYFKNAFNRKKRIKEFNTELWLIQIEDLILAKIIWIQKVQSDMQMQDILNLLLNPEIDLNYIKEWCNKLKLRTFNLLKNE